MQIIAADIGNSAIKLLSGEDHLRLPYLSDGSPANFADALAKYTASIDGPVFWAVVSVNEPQCQQLGDWVKQHRSKDRFEIITRGQVPLAVIESYANSVGIDRLVAAYAAVSLEKVAEPLIIVDAGTAVTIDVVSGQSSGQPRQFEGGVIFPGVGASLSVLNSATADLPDVALSSASLKESDTVEGVVGTQTDMAIANGVCLAQGHAVGGIVDALKKRLPEAKVWITGGGAESIVSVLPETTTDVWQVDAQLVLRGAAVIGRQLDHE